MPEAETTSKRKELEGLFKQFPDVPREVIIKEDVLREGVAFTQPALEYGGTRRTKLYGGGLFTYDYVRPEEALDIIGRVPDEIQIHKGLYGLRNRLRFRCRVNPRSPYVVDFKDGELSLCERENGGLTPIAEVYPYLSVPEYWSKRFEDGTPWKEIVRNEGNCFAFVTLFVRCQHWGPKEECKFCDINENAQAAEARGEMHIASSVKKVEHVVEVLKWLFEEERPRREPYDQPWAIMLTGGAILKKLAGHDEDEFYLQYVKAIRQALASRWPIHLQTAPKPKEIARRYKEAGVDIHNTNMEVWDKRLFEIICPGKNRVVGRDNWVKLMLGEVDVFGKGCVHPSFVQGCETAGPWGLSESEALTSYEECYDYLMSHGIIPRPVSWYKEPMSQLGRSDERVPSTAYFVQIDRLWFEKLTKYRLQDQGFPVLGPGLSELPNSAHMDMESAP